MARIRMRYSRVGNIVGKSLNHKRCLDDVRKAGANLEDAVIRLFEIRRREKLLSLLKRIACRLLFRAFRRIWPVFTSCSLVI